MLKNATEEIKNKKTKKSKQIKLTTKFKVKKK